MKQIKQLIKATIIHECKLMKQCADILETYQGNNGMTWEQLETCIGQIISNSIKCDKEMFMEWISTQRENNLPNSSSGSFMTALLDVDNMFCVFEDMLDELDDTHFQEHMYDLMQEQLK